MKCPCSPFQRLSKEAHFHRAKMWLKSSFVCFCCHQVAGSELTSAFSHAWNIDVYTDKHSPVLPSSSGSSLSPYSEMKPRKVVSRKRWARSLSFELGGDLYAVDIEQGRPPLSSGNSSWARSRDEEESEEFSGMGVPARPTSSRLTPPAALKVTYRCWSARSDPSGKCSTQGLNKLINEFVFTF